MVRIERSAREPQELEIVLIARVGSLDEIA